MKGWGDVRDDVDAQIERSVSQMPEPVLKPPRFPWIWFLYESG